MEFRYQAANSQGQTISGQLSAANEREAARLLRQQDLTPISIAAVGSLKQAAWRRKAAASVQDKVLVIQELATLLQAGVPLAEAVGSIGEAHAGTQIGVAFNEVLKALRAGDRLSQALRATQLELPTYLHQLIAAGELTGKLAQSLQTAAAQMAYEERIRQETRNALTYPTILVFSGIAATLLVFLVVVPKFANLLKNRTADIPQLSKWVIGAGLFVKEHLLWVGLGFLALVFGFTIALGNSAVRAKLFETLAKTPILGIWLMETELGRWAAMLGALLENRVPIISAMELAQNGVRIGTLQRKLEQAVREVRAGKKIAEALEGTRALSMTGLNLIRVGERSGELAPMLRALASLYENAGRDRMKRFLLLLEPLAILVIGSVIGVIMVAIMLAITSLSNISL
jgi:general secretion pathway protein F